MTALQSNKVPTSETSPGHLLVVDDEPFVLSYLTRTLTSAGHTVATAPDGAKALEALSGRHFDLVLSDISMPGMSGIDLLSELRKLDPDLPLILLTGNPDLASAVRAVELGAFRYLTKPLRDEEIHNTVTQALKFHDAARLKRHAVNLVSRDNPTSPGQFATQATLDEVLGSVWMAYQPIVAVAGHRVFAHEALLRTKSQKLPHPGAVLACAERLMRLDDVGRTVRSHVAKKLTATQRETFFVNLHANDLLDETLYDPDAPLSQHALRVVLELTERAALEDIKDVPARMARLRALGFRLAVDDLGAGYAGLTSLSVIKPEFVKIDMSLVRNVHREDVNQRLLKSLTSACRGMGMQVVAEGVETVEERDVLIELGCDFLQGYLLARPAAELQTVAW